MNCHKNCVHGTLIDLIYVSPLEKPRNVAQKWHYREHEFGGFAKPIAIPSTRTDLRQLAPPLSSSERKRAIDDYRQLRQTMSLIISCVHRKPKTESARCCDAITSNRGGANDQCPISQTRAVHRHNHSCEYCCYSCCPASHWILLYNTFEGVVTIFRRAVDLRDAVISKYRSFSFLFCQSSVLPRSSCVV